MIDAVLRMMAVLIVVVSSGCMVEARHDRATKGVSAAHLVKSYRENPSDADKEYKGKRWLISGTVSNVISNESGGTVRVDLVGGESERDECLLDFPRRCGDQVSLLKRGDAVKADCMVLGYLVYPLSNDCRLLSSESSESETVDETFP